jgi:hypothetical protein
MSTFQDKKLDEANDTIKKLTNKYNDLSILYKEQCQEINKLNNELQFFHREMRQHNQQWENMFYSPSPEGYAFEEEKLERKRANSK